MENIPTENFLKRHQHWLLAALSAILLPQFSQCQSFPVRLDRVGAVFHCSHAHNKLENLFLDWLPNRVPIFRRPADCHCASLSIREYLRDNGGLPITRRLYRTLFRYFSGAHENPAVALWYPVSGCSCLRLVGTGVDAELGNNRVPVGKHRLLAME